MTRQEAEANVKAALGVAIAGVAATYAASEEFQVIGILSTPMPQQIVDTAAKVAFDRLKEHH